MEVRREDLQRVNDARNITEDCKENVDQEVGVATTLEEDTDRWEKDGEDDFADITMK